MEPVSGILAILSAALGAYMAWEIRRSIKRGKSWFYQPMWEFGGERRKNPTRFWASIGCHTLILLSCIMIVVAWWSGRGI
jgi:hypothetical protein